MTAPTPTNTNTNTATVTVTVTYPDSHRDEIAHALAEVKAAVTDMRGSDLDDTADAIADSLASLLLLSSSTRVTISAAFRATSCGPPPSPKGHAE